MLVRMCKNIGGYRNGEAWPAPGDTIGVPDNEARDLIANGYAEPADSTAAEHELDITGDGTDAALPPVDPDNPDEEREADDTGWSFDDTPANGDAEATADRDEASAGDGDAEAAEDSKPRKRR